MPTLSRRSFHKQALGSLLTYSLLETLFGRGAFASEVQPSVAKWVRDLDDLGRAVKGQKLRQVEWQQKVEELYGQVELPDLLRFIDFEKLTAEAKLVDNGARSLRVAFPEVEGLPKDLVFGRQVFALKKGRSVVPHGHNNMATAFLILKGDFHGRHYDRLEDREDHILIKPTIDREFQPGEYSSVSDYKDNIHWFEAKSEPAFIFNIHVQDISPGSKLPTGRVYLNPEGKQLPGGLIEAPRIGYQEAHKLYG
ncbi:MAG TPA: hypothetical protein VML55_04370 [Planctomycetaceae bacterium]|nr:hypothetical protein [Planctomycetaceae bacterium]